MRWILPTAAGSGNGNNLVRGMRTSEFNLHIVGTNIDRFSIARSITDKSYLVPRGDAGDEYIDVIRRIVDKEGIDLIVVNSDDEVSPISRHRHLFDARVPARCRYC